jgi:hypothetical protein
LRVKILKPLARAGHVHKLFTIKPLTNTGKSAIIIMERGEPSRKEVLTMMNYEEIRARMEAIEDELWKINMCDARNRFRENCDRERELRREYRLLKEMLCA